MLQNLVKRREKKHTKTIEIRCKALLVAMLRKDEDKMDEIKIEIMLIKAFTKSYPIYRVTMNFKCVDVVQH